MPFVNQPMRQPLIQAIRIIWQTWFKPSNDVLYCMKIDLLEKTRLLLMDVDGVLTDGSIIYTGEEMITMIFNVKDGLGLKMLQRAGVITGIVTGRRSTALSRRSDELGITLFYDAVSDKGALLDRILDQAGCRAEQTAFIGDDLPDIPLMKKVGIPIAVADARPEVKSCARIVTASAGGKGAVREICDDILRSKNLWLDAIKNWV
jgi:3-deoxy-D-manno-octulosonate 8-phosphate phosphatase (KDO 8-P phosphatase)